MLQESKHYTIWGISIMLICVGVMVAYQKFTSTSSHFPVGKMFTVYENEALTSISTRLYEEGYITSPLLFRIGVSYVGKDTGVQLGGYTFTTPQSLLGMITAFVQGHPTSPLLSVTIPEGSTVDEIASLLTPHFPSFSVERFRQAIEIYKAYGKLFPSTYFLLPSYNENDLVKMMLATFAKKSSSVITQEDITSPLVSEHDVLVLASILEGEAKTKEDMKIVSGILRARLMRGMRLQVDVAKETYTTKGLPEEPINNPGLVAIDAALHPTVTEYLYYLTGKDGTMYYAKTFEEHKRNIKKYLR